jgi:hypothetical protein
LSIEREKFHFTYQHEGWRHEGQETKLDIQVFHQEGKHPIFVVNESLDNKGPGLDWVTSDLAGGMMNQYDLKPGNLQWYEQQSNGDYTRIDFRTTQINPDTNVATQWIAENKEYNIPKHELEGRIAKGIVEQPDDISREIQQRKQWDSAEVPAEGKAVKAEYEKQSEGVASQLERDAPKQQNTQEAQQQQNTQDSNERLTY